MIAVHGSRLQVKTRLPLRGSFFPAFTVVCYGQNKGG